MAEMGRPQKPIDWAMVCIVPASDAGHVVLDLFGGSGSTLIACEKTQRSCYMMELDPKYIETIVARLERFTGKKAELLNG